jgi:hypothetical protein
MNDVTRNIDPEVAAGFGHEWSTFRQTKEDLSAADRQAIFQSYFHIFPWNDLPPDPVGIDVGCGSGRWSVMVAPKVGHLHLLSTEDIPNQEGLHIPPSCPRVRLWQNHKISCPDFRSREPSPR